MRGGREASLRIWEVGHSRTQEEKAGQSHCPGKALVSRADAPARAYLGPEHRRIGCCI